MKAMVLLNLAIDTDIANGTRGHIQDIILDEREGLCVPDEDGVVELKYPPVMIRFKPDKKTKLIFDSLPLGVLSITPSLARFTPTGRTEKIFKIVRCQVGLT